VAARRVVANHVGRHDRRVLEPDYYAAHGELLSPQNVAIAANSSEWYPELGLLRESARNDFMSGANTLRNMCVIGIGGVKEAIIVAVHEEITGAVSDGYLGVVMWAFPNVQLVGDLANAFVLAVDPLTGS
jgi:hypothetical protein